jgi:outer membrane protein OmpA-like peptidoglycan-associated protein
MAGRSSGQRRWDEEQQEAPAEPAAAPALVEEQHGGQRPNVPATSAAVLGMQRGAGNASVARLLSAPANQLARKAQVDLPGWGDPLFGDDDTDVTFDPTGSYKTAQMEAALADPFRNSKELGEGLKQGQWSVSGMTGRDGYGGEVNIKAGTKGTVKIAIKAHWFFDQKVNDEYDQEFSCSWDVEADLKGNLKIKKSRPEMTPMESEAPFQLVALNPVEDEASGTVQISPQWQSFQNTDIPNVQLGLNIGGEKSPVSGGPTVTLGNERTFPAGSLVRTFDLKLKVVDIPPPEPKVIIGPITMRRHATHDVLFEKPKQDKVSGKAESELFKWYARLTPETRVAVREGTEKVKLDGYASTTDKATNNRELARRRVESVKTIMRDFGAKTFDDAAFGEYVPGVGEPEGEVEAQDDRKVVIEIIEAPETIYGGDDAYTGDPPPP